MLRSLFIHSLVLVGAVTSVAVEPHITVGPASGQVIVNETPIRYRGSSISIVIAFDQPVATPSLSKITVTNTDASTETITPIAGGNSQQWLYTVKSIQDGAASLSIDAGCTTLISDSSSQSLALSPSYNLVIDTNPVVGITSSVAGNVVTFIATVTSGMASTDTGSPWNDSLLTVANGRVLTKLAVGNLLTITVAPFGYGTVTLNALAGLATDAFQNKSAATSGTGVLNPTIAGSVPYPTQVIGLSLDNRVYRTGDTITMAVDFTRAVKIAGTNPYLTLNSTGSGPLALATFSGFANGSSTSGTRLLFTYTVQDGQRSVSLDLSGTDALVVPDQSALTGIGTPLDYLTITSMPTPGATGSLAKNSLYSINVEAAKPIPSDIIGADEPKACGIGSSTGLILGGGSLAMLLSRRRRR